MSSVLVGLLRHQNMAKPAFLVQLFPLAYMFFLYSCVTLKVRTEAEAALFCPHLHKSKMAAQKNIFLMTCL